eukprot:12926768-Prorocentrum_lima.AAC.1
MKDREGYQELCDSFKHERGKNSELRKTLAELKRRIPNPWDNVDPRTPTPSCKRTRHNSVVADRRVTTMDPGHLPAPPLPELNTPPRMSTPG